MSKHHSLAILALLATTTTNPDCSLESAQLPPPPEPVCSELSPDVQASNGWRNVQASQTAEGELFFRYKARPTVAGLNGLLAIAPEQVDTFSDAAILVRFAEDGAVDARNGSIYDSELVFPYEAGVWYDIAVSADLISQTYSVDIGRCGEPLSRLITKAAFRFDAPDSTQLTHWAAWSSQSATLDVATASWGTTGSCQPSTCQSLGRECGSASDGCGTTLSCGGCASGESCSSGTCVAASTPPPTCEPLTCQTLGRECGSASDGCGGSLSCGGCASGESCSSGVCIASSTSAPPAGSPGDPYVHVTPTDVGVSIGPGVIAAYPTITYSGSCTITTPGTTIENRIINCSSLNVYASNVTIRNSVLNLTGTDRAIKIGDGGGSAATGFTLEYSHLNYQNDGKVIIAYNGSGNGDYRNMTVRNNDIEGGHDFFYIEGRFDGLLVENNVMGPLGCADGSDPHADGFQMGELAPISGKMTIRGNYFDPKKGCTKTAILFSTGSDSTNTTDILFENNRLTTWGANTIWCANSNSCIVRYNVYDSAWEAQVGNRCTSGDCNGGGPACCGYPSKAVNFGSGASGSYSCNRYESDGGFIEQHYVSGVTHSTSGCPSY